MANIFVISDTHFGHENFLKFEHNGEKIRKFSNVYEMDAFMIEQWNSVVSPSDKVYHLGDVFFGDHGNAEQVLRRLNGRKRLIIGNHDAGKDWVLGRYFEKINMWRVWKEERLLFSHVPLHPSNLTIGLDDKKTPKWEDREKATFVNVHGHIHQNKSPDGPYFNACVEHHNYKPIAFEELREACRALKTENAESAA